MATMANIYLSEDLDTSSTTFKVANNNTAIYGGATDPDNIEINSGVVGVSVASTVESVTFSATLAEYKFKKGFGANLEVYQNISGVDTLVATITDVDGKSLVFSDAKTLNITYDMDNDYIKFGDNMIDLYDNSYYSINSANSNADTVSGSNGDDTIMADDTDTIDGGDNVTVNLVEGKLGDIVAFETAVSATNLVDNHLVNVETICIKDIGSDNTEVYDFSAQSEDLIILSAASKDSNGDDIVNGLTIVGGQGADTISGTDGDDIITIDNNDTKVFACFEYSGDSSNNDTLKITADVDMTASGKEGIAGFENIILDGDGADLTLTSESLFFYNDITAVTGFTTSGTDIEQLIISNVGGDSTNIDVSDITFTNAGATLIAGDNGDYLAGGNGNDSIILGNGNDIVWFADTGANNGDDTIVGFDIANDILDFSAFNTLTIDQKGGSDTAIVAYTSADTSDVDIADKIVLYSDATETDIDEESEIASLIEGNSDSFALNGKAVLITGDADSSDDVMNIWYIDSSLDGTAGDVTETDVVLIGHTDAGFDLDTLTTSNLG